MASRSTVLRRIGAIARDVDTRRIRDGIERRILDVPHLLAWHAPSSGACGNRAKIDRFRARHAGERCFILGNGPSLSRMDLTRLRGEITFGLNRIYLLFDRLGFAPTYYVCVNELVLEQFAGDIGRLPMPKFLNWDRRHLFAGEDPDTLFVRTRLGLGDTFGRDPVRSLSSGGTVTYVALQLAYYMGFREVVLLGVDHDFIDKGTPNRIERRDQAADANHFHPDYFPKGSLWQLPDLPRSELAYALAREAFAREGRRIVDATAGGKCPVFEKVAFNSL
jgi:hypothetical protein